MVALRVVERDDLPRLHELLNDVEVLSRVSSQRPLPSSLAALQADFDAEAAAPPRLGIRFVVEVDGLVIGDCGLHAMDFYSLNCHLGIALARDEWGKGYGTDAVRVLVEYAFTHLRMHKVCLEVLADDERAVGAYRRAGFVEEGRLRDQSWHRGGYHDLLRMAVLRGAGA